MGIALENSTKFGDCLVIYTAKAVQTKCLTILKLHLKCHLEERKTWQCPELMDFWLALGDGVYGFMPENKTSTSLGDLGNVKAKAGIGISGLCWCLLVRIG